MQIRFISNTSAQSPSLLRKLLALVITVAVAAVALMFGAVLLLVLLVLGTLVWAYVWWKMRGLRKQMQAFSSQQMRREAQASNDNVFEGEVVRVVEPEERR